MTKNKTALLNTIIEKGGWRLHHDPNDVLLRNLQDLPENLRFRDPMDPQFELGIAEICMQIALRRIIDRQKINLVIDVGANEGQFATSARHLGYGGTVLSIEPSAACFAKLSSRHPPSSTQINVRCLAGDEAKVCSFSTAKGSVFSSLHRPSENGKAFFEEWMRVERGGEEIVEQKTIDDLMSEFIPQARADSQRILLKTDTQGHDLHVLKGAESVLRLAHAVLIEYPFVAIYEGAPTKEEIERFLAARGFKLAGIFPITKVPNSEELLESDALFVKV